MSEAPKAKPDQGVEVLEEPVCEGDADQSEADDEEPGDCTAPKRQLQRGVDPTAGRLCGAQVGAHRDVHPHVTGRAAQHRADHEEHAGLPAEREREEEEDDRADPGDDRVLPVQVRLRAFLDRLRDLLHPVVALGLPEDPEDQEDGEEERQEARRRDGQQDGAVKGRHCARVSSGQ